MKVKKRLDVLLTEQGYADTRSKAQAIIMSGMVYVDGQKADKPGISYEETVSIEVRGETCPYVSRGGLKLEKALRDFGVKPDGYVCSDSGASTGGFTDCLLQQGAKKVFAIDVGYGQLDWKIRSAPRVVDMERTNIRFVTPEQLGEPLDLSVVDVSFISLKLVLPVIKSLLKQDRGQVLCLIKPQFEAGKAALGKNGIVTSSAYRFLAAKRVICFACDNGFDCIGLIRSPIEGGDGNREYLAYFVKKACIKPLIDDKMIKRITLQ